MPNWTTVTAAHLDASSVSGKVAKIRAIASSNSKPDPVPAAIAAITAEVRGAIGFSRKYLRDRDAAKIPLSLLDLVVKKIVRDCSKALGAALTKDESDDESTYEKRLDKIRLGQWPIEDADNPEAVSTVQSPEPGPQLSPRSGGEWGREAQDGI